MPLTPTPAISAGCGLPVGAAPFYLARRRATASVQGVARAHVKADDIEPRFDTAKTPTVINGSVLPRCTTEPPMVGSFNRAC